MIDNIFTSLLAEADVQTHPRLLGLDEWDKTLDRLQFIPVAYSHMELEYQLAYLRGSEAHCQDMSLILYHDNRPCGVWPICYTLRDGKHAISNYSSHGLPMLPPMLIAGLAEKTQKSITKKCFDALDVVRERLTIKEVQSGDSYTEKIGVSNWCVQALQRGCSITLAHELFVDLTPDMASIKGKFRKSFKSLITEGARIWKVGVLRSGDPALWDSFRMLHQRVAGKVTRSSETWNLQYLAIVTGHAFLVHLHNKDGELVGGGYFAITRDQGVYNVGAYDRALFAQPLGHVVQYTAIEEMKRRGVRWYKIGLGRYQSQEEKVTSKQISIGDFMQGFASHLFPRYIIQHNVGMTARSEA